MKKWTITEVEERLAEAASVLRRLPEKKLQGYYTVWPEITPEFSDLVGQKDVKPLKPWPLPDAITRMEECLSWTVGLEPVDGKIVWLRASGARWKTVCWTVGLKRSAAHEHWLYGLCLITLKLNRQHAPAKRSRRHIIDLARESSR